MARSLTAARLRELITYDPEAGAFTWKVMRRGPAKAGGVAGYARTNRNKAYWIIRVDGPNYAAHRLAWLYVTGKMPQGQIDHIDGNSLNNRWSNLRCVTNLENSRNRRIDGRNTSGFKGAYWRERERKWASNIRVEGKLLWLGYFATKEDAHAAYMAAAEKHFGEFARAS